MKQCRECGTLSPDETVFCCSFSAKKPPAMPVRMKSFSFKNNTSNANMRVATNRISEQRR